MQFSGELYIDVKAVSPGVLLQNCFTMYFMKNEIRSFFQKIRVSQLEIM